MRPLLVLVLVAVLAGCGGDGTDDGDAAAEAATITTDAPATTVTTATTAPGAPAPTAAPGPPDLRDVQTVVGGLAVPWGLAFVDADTFFVTERPGSVRVVDAGVLRPEPVATLDAVDRGEGGLLGIALHPDFPQQRLAYLYYTAEGGNRVSRFPVGDDLVLGAEEVLLDGIPSARFHDGGRIAFGPDGMLYVTTGDATDPFLAADVGSLAGKVLRLTPEGGVPADNPFAGSPVWSYGHRNPQGLAWDAAGNLYASEHGPTGEFGLCCHDEVNLIRPGAFYGWPYRAGRVEAASGTPPAQPVAPVAASGGDTWAPAGVAAVAGEGGPELLVATLGGQRLLRLQVDPSDPAAVTGTGTALDGVGRLRAAAVAPDGCLHLTTSNTDGRGDAAPDDDRVLRACPGG